MTNEVIVFNYTELDASTADFLRTKETNMREIVGKAYTELGRELKEARERLGNNRNGVFEKWLEHIGMNKKQASRLIQRYDMVTICHDKTELLEDLPLSLSYEIAKPSADSTPSKAQAKAEVLDGDIDTLKAYKERIKELETETAQARKSERIALQQLERAETRTQTEYIEVVRPDERMAARLQEYEEMFGDIANFRDRHRATNLDCIMTSVISFSKDIRDFARRHAYLIQYQETIDLLGDITQREYDEAVNALHSLAGDFVKRSKTSVIIESHDAHYTDIN